MEWEQFKLLSNLCHNLGYELALHELDDNSVVYTLETHGTVTARKLSELSLTRPTEGGEASQSGESK